MKKAECLQAVKESGVVAVIRAGGPDELLQITRALNKGGVRALEITMTSPGAIETIKTAVEELGDEAIIGVGSVLDAETARMAILAGAQFVVSPVFKPELVAMCKRYSKVCIPGAFTPTEILTAWEAGADVIKIFPATKLGPGFIKDLKGPMPQIEVTPTGGVTLENTAEFIKAGAAFVGVGSALVDKKLVAEQNWDALSELAAKFAAAAKSARS
ncbi:MAG: bifunctional 4-hydroxy-2-oxoglutarate aldolase/2-dehydro-3-deoxy-phosphogluconate aldolase [Firmicutes bacterium]|jgi:2-dehydro-3-deoxyphosphogluconate aldolase/(4S)-4-hydroxy-2-oxoglutarate aldolase|nr:bifunctional 4-hydroxy-2-oxoglutarate aldolase/2-dehydro-3-deoxy-phosphogluconate aldolase [Bacillota bacterium]